MYTNMWRMAMFEGTIKYIRTQTKGFDFQLLVLLLEEILEQPKQGKTVLLLQ